MDNSKIKMHKKMAMSGKSPVGKMQRGGMATKKDNKRDIRKTESMIGASKSSRREQARKKMMGGGMMKPTGYNKGGRVRKPITVKEITPKGKKGVLIFKGKAKDYKNVGKSK
jgi:hypothetical protein